MSRVPRLTYIAAIAAGGALTLAGLVAGPRHASGKDAAPAHVVVPTDSASIAAGQKTFKANCVPCHGPTGHGDGPTAAALNPKPRNFTHPKEFKSKNDDEIFAVISKGGAASKLSPVMPPWGPKLKPAQILQLIAFIHTLAPHEAVAPHAAARDTAAKDTTAH